MPAPAAVAEPLQLFLRDSFIRSIPQLCPTQHPHNTPDNTPPSPTCASASSLLARASASAASRSRSCLQSTTRSSAGEVGERDFDACMQQQAWLPPCCACHHINASKLAQLCIRPPTHAPTHLTCSGPTACCTTSSTWACAWRARSSSSSARCGKKEVEAKWHGMRVGGVSATVQEQQNPPGRQPVLQQAHEGRQQAGHALSAAAVRLGQQHQLDDRQFVRLSRQPAAAAAAEVQAADGSTGSAPTCCRRYASSYFAAARRVGSTASAPACRGWHGTGCALGSLRLAHNALEDYQEIGPATALVDSPGATLEKREGI